MKTNIYMENIEVAKQEIQDEKPYEYVNKKLWNPNGFLVMSFFFSFLPSAILFAINYGRTGQIKKRNINLILYILVFAAAMTVAIKATNDSPRYIFIALNIGLGIMFKNKQLVLFQKHKDAGGRKASYILPIIISIGVVGLFIYSMFYTTYIPDNYKVINGSELYYTDNVTSSEVESLGNYLVKEGMFVEGGNKISVKIDKKYKTYIFSFIVDKENLTNQETIQSCKDLCKELSTNVFDNNSVEVDLCDDVFKPLKKIKME